MLRAGIRIDAQCALDYVQSHEYLSKTQIVSGTSLLVSASQLMGSQVLYGQSNHCVASEVKVHALYQSYKSR